MRAHGLPNSASPLIRSYRLWNYWNLCLDLQIIKTYTTDKTNEDGSFGKVWHQDKWTVAKFWCMKDNRKIKRKSGENISLSFAWRKIFDQNLFLQTDICFWVPWYKFCRWNISRLFLSTFYLLSIFIYFYLPVPKDRKTPKKTEKQGSMNYLLQCPLKFYW